MSRIILFCAVLGFLLSCKKMPDDTQSGEGTFGCKVNGKLFVPKRGAFLTPSNIDKWVYEDNGVYRLQLRGHTYKDKIEYTVGITGDSVDLKPGVYDLTFLSKGK